MGVRDLPGLFAVLIPSHLLNVSPGMTCLPFPLATRDLPQEVPAQVRDLTSLELLPPRTLSPRATSTSLSCSLCSAAAQSEQYAGGDATCGGKLLISSDFFSPLCLKIGIFCPAAQLLSSRISKYLTAVGVVVVWVPPPPPQFLSYTV